MGNARTKSGRPRATEVMAMEEAAGSRMNGHRLDQGKHLPTITERETPRD